MFQEKEIKKISIKEIMSNIPIGKEDCDVCNAQIEKSLSFMFEEIYKQLLEYDEIVLGDASEHFSSIKRIPSLSDLENVPSEEKIIYTKNNSIDEFKVVFVRKKMEEAISD